MSTHRTGRTYFMTILATCMILAGIQSLNMS
ncbi:hypothetical protein SM11_chr1318 [Sinorhizobium meliloti SM11]|uniref:Uncharacterized protein n=1 Tax=Sinorhizobium meliloti (strain SM11) TaxID=707241 RepID=F7X5F5_SINMM|nr:hypothetical protein SM11_chr1318 [Sinorhizobium meliloti SM11]